MIFGFGKKKLANEMIGGVDKVKVVLYKIVLDIYLDKGEDRDRAGYLAAAAVNEIFDCHSELSRENINKNKQVVIDGIKELGSTHLEFKQIITDAIRVYFQAEWMLTGKLKDSFREVFKNAQERGVFVKGGKLPDPTTFLDMTDKLVEQYKIM